ncbi:MAG: hypothetical protein AVDCRST_MAG49-499 [uncultured Thermomicrobiales bacterium]|uniref:ATPase n=1 Tax=uncultured Thermomicrobiales bacterium TaxID=1645740 RepID=A0A6J4U177_9BACT|nr:MAG: hypothetical protein AVDCRST_MAG49-499 [uncultured Thermomicrobiales bacterium]
MRDGEEPQGQGPDQAVDDDPAVDIHYLVDRLLELVGTSKRFPFSGRVLVDENEFFDLIEQLRDTVPQEIRQAQRVIKERERIIGDAQEEAAKILQTARQRAEYFVSEQGILNEAKQKSEEVLRQAEEARKRNMGEVDLHALKQFGVVEDAMREGLAIIENAMRDTVELMEEAKSRVAP